jgi:hypothetical protein
MLGRVCAVALGAALATGAAAVAAPTGAVGTDWASATLSSTHAGARPVALVVSLHTELQCGKLRNGSLALTFPAGARLPRTIPTSAIAVQGKQPASVKLANRTLSITLAPPAGLMCNVIGPGNAKVIVPRAAGTLLAALSLGRYARRDAPATLNILQTSLASSDSPLPSTT